MNNRTTFHLNPKDLELALPSGTEARLRDLHREHAASVNQLTEDQFVEAVRQALPDFQIHVGISPDGRHGQMVVYLPGSEADRWKRKYYDLLKQSENP